MTVERCLTCQDPGLLDDDSEDIVKEAEWRLVEQLLRQRGLLDVEAQRLLGLPDHFRIYRHHRLKEVDRSQLKSTRLLKRLKYKKLLSSSTWDVKELLPFHWQLD